MTLPLDKAINQAFDFLDTNYITKWSTRAATRARLIEAFSQTDKSPFSYLGYKSTDGIRHAMQRALLEPKINKPPSQEYRDWLLQNINLFYCTTCCSVYTLSDKVARENQCKNCNSKESSKKTVSKRKMLYDYLANKCCTDCGISNPIVLEFDHIDPTNKKHNVSSMMGYSWSKILEEINKCDIVCANCHRIRTAKQFNWYNF